MRRKLKRWVVRGVYHFNSKGLCYQEQLGMPVLACSSADAKTVALSFIREHIRRDYSYIVEVNDLCWLSCDVVLEGG